jgi:thymidine phosphorylase
MRTSKIQNSSFTRTPALITSSNNLLFYAIGSSKEMTTMHETLYDNKTWQLVEIILDISHKLQMTI